MHITYNANTIPFNSAVSSIINDIAAKLYAQEQSVDTDPIFVTIGVMLDYKQGQHYICCTRYPVTGTDSIKIVNVQCQLENGVIVALTPRPIDQGNASQ